MKKKIRVLVVDDSAVVRQTLKEILDSAPDIEVIGTAADPYIAANKVAQESQPCGRHQSAANLKGEQHPEHWRYLA